MKLLGMTILKTPFLFFGITLSSGYDVLSYKRPAFQSTTLSWIGSEANKAVDGNHTSCARTYPIGPNTRHNTAWWYVDLGDIQSVYNIWIQFENFGEEHVLRQRGRFAGFSLYLSNSTQKEDGYMCYKDGPELPPLNFTTNCIRYGRYVIYYNERLSGVTYPEGYESISYSQLCEVVIKGCSRGKYAINCKMNCPTNCFGTGCDIINGTCMKCKPGWKGEKCQTSCPIGSYGQDCKFQCSGHCKDKIPCDQVTGECVRGCASGWTGIICNKICDDGRYGINCTFYCSGHCFNDELCNKETGYCDSGCRDGYIGDLCKKECITGWFGKECKERCSGHCAENGSCNHVDGICSHGCEDGFTGLNCITPCRFNHFGRNCSRVCSSKCFSTCRHNDGSCVCSSGWMGSPFCNNSCPPNTYGKNCAHHCSPNCANDTCDRFDGSCVAGCKEPFYGESCHLGQTRSDISATDRDSLVWVMVTVILVILNTFAFVAYIYSKRKRIARIWNEKRNNSQIYANSLPKSTQEIGDIHTYQELDIFGHKENNYINSDR